MTEFRWCFSALISHWRRSPFQLIALLLGLSVATALWSGVQAINFQARQSYDKAADFFGEKNNAVIRSSTGPYFSDAVFGQLRQLGWKVSPLLEGQITVAGRQYKVLGIDPLSYPVKSTALPPTQSPNSLIKFIHPGQALVNPETYSQFNLQVRHWITNKGIALPLMVEQPDIPAGLIIVDMAWAQNLLEKEGLISKLLISREGVPSFSTLPNLSVPDLQIVESSEELGVDGLTDSFHLNLTAFGFLSFFVGLFIVHSAIGLAFEQRRSMIRTLRACGVSASQLAIVLLTELLLFAIVAGSAGMVAGYGIAAFLLPDVAASLRGLYGVEVGGELSLKASWWALGLGMSSIGALLAAANSLYKSYRLPLLAPASPNAWRAEQEFWLIRQALLALFLFTCAFLLPIFGDGLVSAFAMMGCLLLGAALLLPFILSLLLKLGQSLARRAVPQWFWADGQQQLSGLSLALMALFLALSVNIGVGTMVESFRTTFLQWLDTRLVSEIYVRNLKKDQVRALDQLSKSNSNITALLPIWNSTQKVSSWPTEIYGFLDHETYHNKWQLFQQVDTVWEKVAKREGVLISEQMARKLDLSLNDPLIIPTETNNLTLPVIGIFPDYGNPKGLIMMNIGLFVEHWPSAPQSRFGLRVKKGKIEPIIDLLRNQLGLTEEQVIDQTSLKAYSVSIFEKTFAITVALNSLTLLVAGIAILTGLLSLSQSRLPQLAPLWAMGITRKSLAKLELLKSISLSAFTALFAIPFGILLAWCLVAIVNVEAFGWRLPLFLFPGQWASLFFLALVTAFISSLLPVYRLYRIQAAALLKVFADER